MLEIERKFLIGELDPDGAFLSGAQSSAITQVYLVAGPLGSERVRARTRRNGSGVLVTEFTHTRKQPVRPGVDEEVEVVVSEVEHAALAARMAPGTAPVVKTRWTVPHGGLVLEIDHIVSPVELWVLEVEFPSEDGLHARVDLPSEVSVVAEVTGDPAFKNASLARTVA